MTRFYLYVKQAIYTKYSETICYSRALLLFPSKATPPVEQISLTTKFQPSHFVLNSALLFRFKNSPRAHSLPLSQVVSFLRAAGSSPWNRAISQSILARQWRRIFQCGPTKALLTNFVIIPLVKLRLSPLFLWRTALYSDQDSDREIVFVLWKKLEWLKVKQDFDRRHRTHKVSWAWLKMSGRRWPDSLLVQWPLLQAMYNVRYGFTCQFKTTRRCRCQVFCTTEKRTFWGKYFSNNVKKSGNCNRQYFPHQTALKIQFHLIGHTHRTILKDQRRKNCENKQP